MAVVNFELSLPMISLPTKETVDASFVGLKPLISGCYGEDPDSFDSEIKQLDRLRQTHVSKDYAGCSLLRKYFAQLHLLDARFPKSMTGGVIPLEFRWKDAFTGKQYLQEGIHMEQASVLFNLAALHSQLGTKGERLTEQEIKEACTHFQCAAGVLVYLYDNFGANYCKDMAPELIEMFKTLMLAQAQECYVEKSIKFTSGIKFVTVSKLAAKLYEYYQFVLANLESDSCVAVVKANKDWPRMIQIKTQYYLALSHYCQGGVCKEQGKYGEMVVYYIAAVQVLDKMGKLPKGINEGLKKAIQWLTETAKKEAAEAKKQNDYVFHEKLPPMEHLEAVQGAALAKPNIFQPADPAVIGVDIFSRLVPLTAHEQSSVYSEEKAKLMRTVTAKVEEKDAELEQYLGGLNIAEIRVAQQYKPIVPVQVKQKVEWFLQHIEDVNNLRLQLEELKATCNDVDEVLKMITARKEQEDKDEKEFQSKYGARDESQVCKELWHELDTCVKFHQKAAQSNNDLDTLYRQNSVNINLLTNSMDTVMANLPKISLLESPTVENSDSERLDVVMEEVDKMKKQRKELVSQLRQQISHDDITTSIIGQKENEQEVAMTERLQRHKDLVAIIEQNLTAQEKILQALTDVNAKHAVLRETQQDISSKQEQYFGAILQSADVFPVLQVKVQEGLRFFSQLKDKVTKLQRRTNDICDHQQRKREAQQRISPAPPTSVVTSPPPPTGPVEASHDLPPVRPPKRDDQRGEPLTNQNTPSQPHPPIPPVTEPVSFQQPVTSPTLSISSHDEQHGFSLYQGGLPRGFPSQQQGLPTQQQNVTGLPLQLHGIQQKLPQEGIQLPHNVEQHGTFPDQQVMSQHPPQPYPEQRLPTPQSVESPSSQPPTLTVTSSSYNTVDILPVVSDPVSDVMMQSLLTSLPSNPSVTIDTTSSDTLMPVPNSSVMSIPSSTIPGIPSGTIPMMPVPSTMVSIPSSTISSSTVVNISNAVMSIPSSNIPSTMVPVPSSTMVPISSSSIPMVPVPSSNIPSSTMMPVPVSAIPSSTEVSTPNSRNMASIVDDKEAISSGLQASIYSDVLSGGVITTAMQSNSLDQLNPLGEKKPSWSKNENKHTTPGIISSTVTTAAITDPVVTTSIDVLLQKQQEQHSMELKKERTLLLEQLELQKRQQEQDKMMSNSHAALLQLVQQQQQSIHQQQVAIQQCHKENALLRQDRDTIEVKYRSMINEEQGKRQAIQQQLGQSTNDCQQYKQQLETQQKHLQQLSHAVKMLDEQNKQLMQQHAGQLSHLEQQHKQHMAGMEEKHRVAYNQLQQEHKAAENSYKQEIERLTEHINTITRQQMKPIPMVHQQPTLPKANPGQSLPPPSLSQLPMQQPLQGPHQSYQPHPPTGVLYMQKPTTAHSHQPSSQQPHPGAQPYYTQAFRENPNSYQKLPPRP